MGSKPVGISGSRSAAILGLSPYQTQVEIWQNLCEARRPGFNEERGYILEKFDGNASTRFGLAFEDSIIGLSESEKLGKIYDLEGEYTLPGIDFPVTCHIDGRFSADEIYEAKTVYIRGFQKNFGEPGTDRIPIYYQTQVQHNMMLTEAESCTVAALVFPESPEQWEEAGWQAEKGPRGYILRNGNKTARPDRWARALADMGFFHLYHVRANRDTQKMMLEAYREFWFKNVVEEVEPEISNYADIQRLFTAPKGELIAPPGIQNKLREYADLNKELGASGHLAKRKEALKIEILNFCRQETTVESEDTVEKVVFLDDFGNSLGSYNGRQFRVKG